MTIDPTALDEFINRTAEHCYDYTHTMVVDDMTPAKLQIIADWLDSYDRLAQAVIDGEEQTSDALRQARENASGDTVQMDLRRWADELANRWADQNADLTYWLTLDYVDGDGAVFTGPNDSDVKIDRAAWIGQGRPTKVTVAIPRGSENSS